MRGRSREAAHVVHDRGGCSSGAILLHLFSTVIFRVGRSLCALCSWPSQHGATATCTYPAVKTLTRHTTHTHRAVAYTYMTKIAI